jgi:hypothetical protein
MSSETNNDTSKEKISDIEHLCHHILRHPHVGRLKQALIAIIRNPNHRLFFQHMMAYFIPHFNDPDYHELYHYLTNHPIPQQYEPSHEPHYISMSEIIHRIITNCQKEENKELRQIVVTLVQKVLHMPY